MQFESPIPYVESMSPKGELKIKWDLPMKLVKNPLLIPITRVAVKANLLETEEEKMQREAEELLAQQQGTASGSNSAKLRQLKSAQRQEVWFEDEFKQEKVKMLILDALEVKMVKDPENMEEEADNIVGFNWNIVEFNEYEMVIKMKWKNPK